MTGTFKKVGGEPGLVDRSVGHKLQPQLIGAAFDVVGFVVAAETAEQPAALPAAVSHLHVVVAAAVVFLNLQRKQRTGLNIARRRRW